MKDFSYKDIPDEAKDEIMTLVAQNAVLNSTYEIADKDAAIDLAF